VGLRARDPRSELAGPSRIVIACTSARPVTTSTSRHRSAATVAGDEDCEFVQGYNPPPDCHRLARAELRWKRRHRSLVVDPHVAGGQPVSQLPTSEQHRALLEDCWELARGLPTSGVLDRARRPYRAIRFERKLDAVANDPEGLLEYIRGMARRTSEGLESLVEYNRLDLSVEMLIMDESKIYAPLFSQEDRTAARAKLARRTTQVEELARDRATRARDAEAARENRIDAIRRDMPSELGALRDLAAQQTEPETAIAVNALILAQAPRDVLALNRLGRAYEALGATGQAQSTFRTVVTIDPINKIAKGRLRLSNTES
jgi:hypothetical protein